MDGAVPEGRFARTDREETDREKTIRKDMPGKDIPGKGIPEKPIRKTDLGRRPEKRQAGRRMMAQAMPVSFYLRQFCSRMSAATWHFPSSGAGSEGIICSQFSDMVRSRSSMVSS